MTSLRQSGYRLLGYRFDYILHARPLEWPIVAGHAAVGYLLAVELHGFEAGTLLGNAALGIALWVGCLNGGTLALNSAFDRDVGDIAYLKQPPPPPRRLALAGSSLMLIGLGLAVLLLPRHYQIAYGVCVILSVLYSVPPVRLKAVPGADWVINMAGFGALTPYAGWAATGLPVTHAGRLVFVAFAFLFAALYPLTQIYQFEEDARRGDRTLARTLGIRWSLTVSILAALLAFALFAVAGLRAEWRPFPHWRWLLLVLAGSAWALVLIPWLRRWPGLTSAAHQSGMYRALAAWAVTDCAVVLAWGS